MASDAAPLPKPCHAVRRELSPSDAPCCDMYWVDGLDVVVVVVWTICERLRMCDLSLVGMLGRRRQRKRGLGRTVMQAEEAEDVADGET